MRCRLRRGPEGPFFLPTTPSLDAYGGVTFWPLAPDGFGTPLRTGSVGQCHDIAISRDGRYMATASFDRFVVIWDIAAKK